MAHEWKRCERCRVDFEDDDQVVVAALQLNVTGINAPPGSERADGVKRLWHVADWPGDTDKYKERARGSFGSVRPDGEPAIW